MADNSILDAILIKKIEGIVYELMIKTKTDRIVDNNGKLLSTTLSEIIASIASKATPAEVDQRIQAVIGSAPNALDTLKEIADALNNDPNFATTITGLLANKVDKISGKSLSANDFTTALKTKLEGLSNYSHPATHSADMITDSSTKVMMTAAERTKLQNLSGYQHPATHSADMITETTNKKFVNSTEKSKISASARVIVGESVPADLAETDLFIQVIKK